MSSRKSWFFVHRWLGLVISLQLLAWSVGGFVFSILDIDDVHGDIDRTEQTTPALDLNAVRLPPGEAVSIARTNDCGHELTRIALRSIRGAVVYILFSGNQPLCTVSAESGSFTAMISKTEAEEVALADFAPQATVRSTTLITDEPPGEYRGGLLPAYRVDLDHSTEPHIYLSAVTGEVTKRRNRSWRAFDFFWMLHIMDYQERDNFNHWLLTFASVLAILTSISGLALWWWRLPRFRAR